MAGVERYAVRSAAGREFDLACEGGVCVEGPAWCVGLRLAFLGMVFKQLGLRATPKRPKEKKRGLRPLPPYWKDLP